MAISRQRWLAHLVPFMGLAIVAAGASQVAVRNTTNLQDVQAWVNDLKAGGRWGIFLLHDVADNPGEYDITPTMLDQLAQIVASSGVPVINYRQGYQTFANIPAP